MKPETRNAFALVVLLASALLAVHAGLLHEAYGDGAPYYGRTTNMDKWSSPWPALTVLDSLAASFGLWCLLRRRAPR